METFEKFEHHAYLTTDELPFLSSLLEKGATSLTVCLRGRTTTAKSKSRISELGIKKVAHTYLEVVKDNLEIKNIDELNKIIDAYKNEGLTNTYITNLVVMWPNGDMQEWKRAVLHVKDRETDRIIPNGRQNALIMKLGLHSSVDMLTESYGTELVKATMCEIV